MPDVYDYDQPVLQNMQEKQQRDSKNVRSSIKASDAG